MKILLSALFITTACLSCGAQDITLPAANTKQHTMSVSEALATRHSVREFDSRELSLQEISNVCWAACGVTRGGNFRTSPTARNKQEIRLMVFTSKAAYEYMAKENTLRHIADGDHRHLMASNGAPAAGGRSFSQDFVKDAPLCLVMVIDFNIFGSNDEGSKMMGCVDAGNVSENINIYCQAAGLATVPRATMDKQAIKKLLNLDDNQLPIMNNPVGYAK